MTRLLRRQTKLKGVVGVVIAYAFVLQMLLAGIVATQMAVADPAAPFTICYGAHSSGDDGSQLAPRINHATCMLCATPAAGPPAAATDVPETEHLAAAAIYRPASPVLLIAESRREPRTSQGPPQTA